MREALASIPGVSILIELGSPAPAEQFHGEGERASCGIRTHDLPLTERVLYQLSKSGYGIILERRKISGLAES